MLKALYRHARLLILDEPTAVLTPQEVEEFFAILRRMREQGKTIVIITHKLSEVLAISDEVTVMRDGKVVGRLQTKETNAAELARLMVGRDVLLRVEKPDAKVRARPCSACASFQSSTERASEVGSTASRSRCAAGEIVGIAGVEGNGQTELIEALAGLVADLGSFPARSTSEGATSRRSMPRRAARARHRAHSRRPPPARPAARFQPGGEHDSRRALPPAGRVTCRACLAGSSGDPANAPRTSSRDFDVRPPDADLPARALSGGNQQKLIIGREFELQPKLLLVSQPTRGVDIGAIEFIHRKLWRCAMPAARSCWFPPSSKR